MIHRRLPTCLLGLFLLVAAAVGADDDRPPEVKRYFDLYATTHGYIEAGKFKKAVRFVEKMREIAPEAGGTFFLEAQALAGRGKMDAAFAALGHGVEISLSFADMLRSDPGFDRMREDPRFDRVVARSEAIFEEFRGSLTTLHRRVDPATAESFASLDAIRESFARRLADLESRTGMMDYRVTIRQRSEIIDGKIASIKQYRAAQDDARLSEEASLEVFRAATEYKTGWHYLGGDAALIAEEARAFLAAYPQSEHAPEVELQRGIAAWLACGPQDREVTLGARSERAAPIFESLRRHYPDSFEADRALVWSLVIADAKGNDARPLFDRLAPRLDDDEELADYAWSYAGKPLFQLAGPDGFDAEDIEGKRWNFETMKGKVVLIEFWSTWCSPCMADLPYLREAYKKFHERGFEIVGVSLDGSKRKSLEKTLQEKGIVWPQIHDGKGFDGPLARTFRIQRLPTVVLLDRKGRVVAFNDEDLRGRRLVETVSKMF